MAELATLGEGQVYLLVTPFVPGPLLDIARQQGFESFAAAAEGGAVHSYLRREGAAGKAD